MYDARDIQRRLSFAEGYANWTVADWERVIFSDETHIEVYGRSRVWVQRPVGASRRSGVHGRARAALGACLPLGLLLRKGSWTGGDLRG